MTSKKYVRKTLLLTKKQDNKLRSLVARRFARSESELVREALDLYLPTK